MTSKPSTTNCPKLSSGLPPPHEWSAGISDSDFELCILLEGEKFYHVLLVKIRHLIRLTDESLLSKDE